jgi:hypothetical protein
VDHPDQTRAIHRQYRYGITEEQWQTKLTEQGGHCALCDATDNLQADHDHNTMWFRGILCSKHNRGLGLLGDNLEGVERAADYLRRTQQKEMT